MCDRPLAGPHEDGAACSGRSRGLRDGGREGPRHRCARDRAGEKKMTIKRILIVDDSPTERHVLNDMLTKAGYEVVASDNGEDAILKAKSVRPDLILMDVVMPGLNGFQATRAISRDPATRTVPIILCTSKSQETDKIWGMRQGARDYVVKPINRDELLSKIVALG
jgi:twitching motility two-component system response regulator PilH